MARSATRWLPRKLRSVSKHWTETDSTEACNDTVLPAERVDGCAEPHISQRDAVPEFLKVHKSHDHSVVDVRRGPLVGPDDAIASILSLVLSLRPAQGELLFDWQVLADATCGDAPGTGAGDLRGSRCLFTSSMAVGRHLTKPQSLAPWGFSSMRGGSVSLKPRHLNVRITVSRTLCIHSVGGAG